MTREKPRGTIDLADGVTEKEASLAGETLRAWQLEQTRPKKGKRYKVLRTIYHTQYNRLCEPGEIVDLDHLDEAAIGLLISQEIVEEVSDGTD